MPRPLRAAALLFLTLALACTTGRDFRTLEALRRMEPGAPVRAFVKGNDIRIFSGSGTTLQVFKAEWARARPAGGAFLYRLAELKVDPSPPTLDRTIRNWREAEGFGADDWVRLARATASGLVPAEPGSEAVLRLAGREMVLVRGEDGELRKAPATREGAAPGLRVDETKLADAMAARLESDLASSPSGLRFFALRGLRTGGLVPYVLLDRDRRQGVLLYAPRTIEKHNRGGSVLDSTRSGASILFESHALALLKNPVSSIARLVNVLVQGLLFPFSLGMPDFAAPPPPLAQGPPMDLADWESRLDRITGREAECGSMRLLIDGDRFFPALEERLRGAGESIGLQIGIFDRDDVAVRVADLLRERSREVEVRVLIDRMSTNAGGNTPPASPMPEGFVPPSTIGSYLEADSKVKVRLFLNPWFSADHSKLIVVDARRAFLGGMNIGREYRYEWHDMMVEVEGPVVAFLQRDFDQAWAHAGPWGDLGYGLSTLKARPRPPEDCAGLPRLRRLYTRTAVKEIRQAVLESIARARSYVYLENPYLVDHETTAALARARMRGVDVRVVLPSVSDFLDTDATNIDRANYLLSHGVQVYLYPGMTHIKALLADGWVCIGSANFNNLSYRFNQELNLATSDPALADAVRTELFEADFALSHNLTEPILVGWSGGLAGLLMDSF
jgi:cardiolipin synthase